MLSSFGHNLLSIIANLFVISNKKSLIYQILKFVGPLRVKFHFFNPLGFEIQSDFDYKASEVKLFSVKALKQYLNEKNLIHGRETATFSKLNALNFETCFRSMTY